jgi:hypothetical protein
MSLQSSQALVNFNGHPVDLSSITQISKAPFLRQLINKQLYSGHLRVDMAQPMSEGNFIVFKGTKRASGKQEVAFSTVS